MRGFRHRFITIEVIVHLKEFMQASGKGRQGMTIVDCESVLKRVSVKTGHGSPDSLWHYIDLAWEEIEVWGNVETALERLRAAERLHDELLELKFDLQAGGKLDVDDFRWMVAGRLEQIVADARQGVRI